MYFLAMVGRKAAFSHSLYANVCHSRVMNHILNCVLQVFLFCSFCGCFTSLCFGTSVLSFFIVTVFVITQHCFLEHFLFKKKERNENMVLVLLSPAGGHRAALGVLLDSTLASAHLSMLYFSRSATFSRPSVPQHCRLLGGGLACHCAPW